MTTGTFTGKDVNFLFSTGMEHLQPIISAYMWQILLEKQKDQKVAEFARDG